MQAEVFLDTAYAIALSSPTDQLHARALELARLPTTTGNLDTSRCR